MRAAPILALAATALALGACVSAAPLALPDDHPASPKAASGLVDTPSALAEYKSAEDFAGAAAPAASTGAAAQHAGMVHGGMDHGAMPGMSHDDMARMQHGGAPLGAGPR